MYIKKYWGSFIGGSDDSLNFQNLDEYNTPPAVSASLLRQRSTMP